MKYQKINSLFKRDENNLIIVDEYCQSEFKYLENLLWECTEKIDGTNMRVIIEPIYTTDYLSTINVWIDVFKEFKITIAGKTDEAMIPKHLLKKMNEIFTQERVYKAFADRYILDEKHQEKNLSKIILYGEGYGMKIQKGGNYISNDVNFILFDVKVDNIWLQIGACNDIAKSLGIEIVPFIGYMTIPQAIQYVKKGFVSNISENREYMAEGLVLKTPCGLLNRLGERIITKIKYKDFLDLYKKTPKKYNIYKIVSNTSDSRYDYESFVESCMDKKEALARLKAYKESDKTVSFFIKEMNSKTDEVYHEIYE